MRRSARREMPEDEPGLPRLRRTPDEARSQLQARLSAAQATSAEIDATHSDEDGLKAFEKWRDVTLSMLTALFDRPDVAENFSARVSPGHVVMSQESQVEQIAIPGLRGGVAFLETLLESLDHHVVAPGISSTIKASATAVVPDAGARVFVVHGHDSGSRLQVQGLLKSLRLEPIVLMEEPGKGRTIIEKFEQESRAGFAVVILTGDDEARGAGTSATLVRRARQNVVLELGYFLGKLGRPRVCALREEGVEVPSDIHGVEYVALDPAGAWKFALASELNAAGYDIDFNLLKRGQR